MGEIRNAYSNLVRKSEVKRPVERSRRIQEDNFRLDLSGGSRPALGPTQPPIQWVPGALSFGVKGSGREAGHSPPYSAEVKNAWSSTPPVRLHGVVLR
jgi:hypothetical protein